MEKGTIEHDVSERGERLIPIRELPHEPWMPMGPSGEPYSYLTIWKWKKGLRRNSGGPKLETIGRRPVCTTKSAVLRFFRADAAWTPEDKERCDGEIRGVDQAARESD